MAKGIIARSREDVLAAAQSKYTTSPSLAALSELKREKGPIAVVCLPCQAHAIRRAQMLDRKLARKISLLIGLYCHYKLDMSASRDLVALFAKGRQPLEVRYRQKDARGWPHNTVEIRFTDGSRWRSPYGPADTINILYLLTPLWRCLTCLDFAAEFADLAVGDPWIRDGEGEWKYADPAGSSTVIVHTKKGEEALDSAVEAARLWMKPIPAEEIERGQHGTIHEKKRRNPLRVKVLRYFGYHVPEYPMKPPRPDAGVIVKEVLFALIHQLSRLGFTRRLLMRLVFSRPGSVLMRIRREQKKRKSRRNARTQEGG